MFFVQKIVAETGFDHQRLFAIGKQEALAVNEGEDIMSDRMDTKFKSEALAYVAHTEAFDKNNMSMEALQAISADLGRVFNFEKGRARMFHKNSDLITANPNDFVERDYGQVSFFVHKGALALEKLFDNREERGRQRGINDHKRQQEETATRHFGRVGRRIVNALKH